MTEPTRRRYRRFPEGSRFRRGPSYPDLMNDLNRGVPTVWANHSSKVGKLWTRSWTGHAGVTAEQRFDFLVLTCVPLVLASPGWLVDIDYDDDARPVALIMKHETDSRKVALDFSAKTMRIAGAPRINLSSPKATDKLMDVLFPILAAFFASPYPANETVH